MFGRAQAVALMAVLAACTSEAPTPPSTQAGIPSVAPSMTEPTVEPAERPHRVSLPALMDKDLVGRGLRIRSELGRNDAYTRYLISYRSGDLSISGLMNVPHGDGPFPVLILNHGYIPPDEYSTGRGFERSQDHLPRNGFVVLHTDYRNYGGSDHDPRNEVSLRIGYIEDAINAVQAVKRSALPYLDATRIGMVGHSMGGGVTLGAIVVRPDLVDAAVVFAPVSSDAVDNFDRWIRRRPALAARVLNRYGTPRANPSFWRDVSARTFFDRVRTPVQIHHGTDDESVPVAWSRDTHGALRAAGARAALHIYPGEHHDFGPAYSTVIRRTVSFFRRHLNVD
jgi:dipeptidyl aminopeptidase/acylaminoacyl peptidase